MMRSRILFAFGFLSLGCNVPDSAAPTGGTDIAAGQCGRGVVVVGTDYQSTQVSLLGPDGSVLSGSFISSASQSSGLSAPLSGDVVLPTMPATADRILLIDRYPSAVVTWVDVQSAGVSAQLSVATGFASNPHDYVDISERKAYVTRFDPNHAPSAEPFDEGNDILIVDPSAQAIVGRIDMMPAMEGEDPKFFPRASRAVRVGDRVYAILSGFSADFQESASSRVVAVDVYTDSIVDTVVLDGIHSCDGLAVSPQKDELAVVCSGEFGGGSVPTLAESGVVLLGIGGVLSERRRFAAAHFGEGPIGMSISYATGRRVVFTTLGRLPVAMDPGADDTAIALDVDTGEFDVLLRSAVEPFSLGDVYCASACGTCFIADAETTGGVVHRFDVSESGQLVNRKQVKADTATGLPPRYLGGF